MLPVETILAVFPKAVRVGKLLLGPLTLYHAAAMEALGIDLGGEVGDEQALSCAWLLAKSPAEARDVILAGSAVADDFQAWALELDTDVEELKREVNILINSTFAVNVPGEQKEGAQNFAGPRGYGWELEIAEIVMHEYSATFDEAMSMPLARIFGLIACCRQRNGGKAGGPDYYERIFLSQIKGIKGGIEK